MKQHRDATVGDIDGSRERRQGLVAFQRTGIQSFPQQESGDGHHLDCTRGQLQIGRAARGSGATLPLKCSTTLFAEFTSILVTTETDRQITKRRKSVLIQVNPRSAQRAGSIYWSTSTRPATCALWRRDRCRMMTASSR